jgi:hypothetical protein
MKYEIKKFECESEKLVSITFIDHFERELPINSLNNDLYYTVTVHGKYVGSNENYHFIEWLEQGNKVNLEPDRRLFGIIKNSILHYEIFDNIDNKTK